MSDNDPKALETSTISKDFNTDSNAGTDTIDWQNDPRIAFDQIRQAWIFEDVENNAEYIWDTLKGSWAIVEPTEPEGHEETDKDTKNKDDELDELEESIGGSKRKSKDSSHQKNKKQKKDKSNKREPPKNRGIYITGLPQDVTENELEKVFGRYGLIAEDLRAGGGKKRIKLYKKGPDSDELKGDAFIVYFKPESVELAIQMMDGSELRLGDNQSIVHVEEAQYQKDDKHSNSKQKTEDLNRKETLDPSQKHEKLKLQKTYQKMNNKLADWDDDAPLVSIPMGVVDSLDSNVSKRWDKVVILKHVFTLEEFAPPEGADIKTNKSEARQEIEEDIQSGAEEIGPVAKIIFFDAEPEGVVSIKFEYKEDAERCVKVMNGRYYSGRRLEAEAYDGRARYKTLEQINKQAKTDVDDDESQRLERFGKWLEDQN